MGKRETIIKSYPGLLRTPRGVEHSQSKLTDKKVIKIRELYLKGWTRQRLADKYDVSPATITHITTRKTWKHVP